MMLRNKKTLRDTALALGLGLLVLAAGACGASSVSSPAIEAAGTNDVVTDDSATDPSATDDSATDDSATDDSATDDSAEPDEQKTTTATAPGASDIAEDNTSDEADNSSTGAEADEQLDEETAQPTTERETRPGEIVLLTPTSGEGSRPLLAWEPVPGAEFYSLVVYGPDNQPYWGSLLTDAQTYVGGPIQLKEGRPGPRVIDGMSWMVIASDGDLSPVATSQLRPIAP